MDKQDVVYPCDGTLLNLRKEWSPETYYIWMNLENTVRSEEARPTAPPTVWFNLYDMSRIGKSIDTKVDWWFPGAGEREEGEMTANGDGIFFFLVCDENILKLMWSGLCNSVNILKTTKSCPLNGSIVWYVINISIKLLLKKVYPSQQKFHTSFAQYSNPVSTHKHNPKIEMNAWFSMQILCCLHLWTLASHIE